MTASVTTPVYRALFCDLRTDRLLDVLPLTETKFDDYIGKPGSLSATVPLPEGSLAARARAARPPGPPPGRRGRAGGKTGGGGRGSGPPGTRPQGRQIGP
ncbi:hypothetical protein ACFT5D_35380, partial [Streptomyces sp. NPDC057144]